MPTIEERMTALEAKQGKIDELVELLEDVKSALKVFIKVGNGVKWAAGIVIAGGAAIAAIRKWV